MHPMMQYLMVLRESGVQLSIQADRLHVESPPGVLSAEDRAQLAEHKNLVLGHLKGHWIVTYDNQWVADRANFTDALIAYEQVVLKAVQKESRPHCVVLWKPTGHWARIANIPEWPKHDQEVSKEEAHV
jgi:hypothetical protein